MRPFTYARPTALSDAVALLSEHRDDARVLAGGTDLIIRLRDGTFAPKVVIDVKRIPEFAPEITVEGGLMRISAGTVMTDIHDSPVVQKWFPALAEAARFVGSVQIRNRATLAGNQCNASPAADTAPPLLIYDARLVVAGSGGEREVTLNDFFVSSGVTTLGAGELVTGVVLPLPDGRHVGSAFQRRTRRRGHDLASVTLAVAVDESGATRLAYGSLGPRPLLFAGESGEPDLEAWFESAHPSPTSMRASPDYRVAMLRVLADRAMATARQRLAQA
ncbi:MAG: xanthine dehydrogenase family protein subunit M [Candidatus Limnocylindrales bacterium]